MEIDIKNVMASLNIGSDDFWEFLNGKIKRYPLLVDEFGWGCFPIYDRDNTLIDIRVLAPKIVDEGTLLVNVHEFAHAYLLYLSLGTKFELNEEKVAKSEIYAKTKEKEYLKLKNKEKNH